MDFYDANGERCYPGFYLGEVVHNDDPENLGRARCMVPGLIEPAGPWALPVGGAGSSGARGRGGYDPPPVGAAVLVGFQGGDIQSAHFFLGGWHGIGEQHSVVPASPADAHKLHVYESERFLIVINEASGDEKLLIKDKSNGNAIHMNAAGQIEIGAEGLGAAPLVNGVVLASGIDPFTGKTYGVLQSASTVVTAKKA